jgi:NhaP-type Na+/H+ or K+/H+ antiporter
MNIPATLLLATLCSSSAQTNSLTLGLLLPPRCEDAWAVYRAASLAAATVSGAQWWAASFASPSAVTLEVLPPPASAGGYFSLAAGFSGAALLAPLEGGAPAALLSAGAGARLPLLSYAPGPPPPPALSPPPLPFARTRGAPEADALLALLAAPGWRQAAVLAERGEPWDALVEALRERTAAGEAAAGEGGPLALTSVARFAAPDEEGHSGGLHGAAEALAEGSARVVLLLAGRAGGAAAVAALRAVGASGRGWALVGVDDWLGAPGAAWEGAVGVGGRQLDGGALARGALSEAALAGAGAGGGGAALPAQLAACGAPAAAALAAARPRALAFSAFEAVWRAAAAGAEVPAPFSGRAAGWLREALLRGASAADFPLLAPGAGGYAVRPAWAAGGAARVDAGALTWLNAGAGAAGGGVADVADGAAGGGVADVGVGGALQWGRVAGLAGGETPSDRAPPAHGGGGGATLAVCLQLLGVAAALILGELLHQLGLTELVPESLATIAVGALLGLCVRALDGRTRAAAAFSEEFFMLALLPIVIYESGYSLSLRVFFGNLRAIAAFAVAGTAVSAAVTSAVIYAGVGAGWGLPPLSGWECATLGALLSATDPVATLVVFGALKVEPRLNALVYGESVLNDAIGIVLFRAAAQFITHGFSAGALAAAAAAAAWILAGAVLWGALAGVACTITLNFANVRGLLGKKNRMADVVGKVVNSLLRGGRGGGMRLSGGGGAHGGGGGAHGGGDGGAPAAAEDEFFVHVAMGSVETTLLLIFGYISFTTGEAVGLSGIIAALFCGITQAVFATPIMSWPGKKVSRAVLKLLAGLADCAIFLQIGMGLALAGDVAAGEVALAAVALAGCLLGRAANVFPISEALNRAGGCGGGRQGGGGDGDGAPIPRPMQVQMWWAGLRGGIAFASALSFPSHHARPVARAVAVLCVATVATMGPTTVPLLRRLGIRYGVEEAAEEAGGGGGGFALAARSGSVAERLTQAIYGKATWLLLKDAGAEGLDAAPVFIVSPAKSPRAARERPPPSTPQGLTVRAPVPARAHAQEGSPPQGPRARAPEGSPGFATGGAAEGAAAAPLSPAGGAAAAGELGGDAEAAYGVRGRAHGDGAL